VRTPTPDDELLATELARLDRKLEATDAERRRLIDLYQAGLLELPELQRRATEVEHRRHDLALRRDALTSQRQDLTRDNQLRRRVRDFATRVLAVIDTLDFDQKQTLLRLVVEDVHVTGWHIQIQLRIPLDDGPDSQSRPPGTTPDPDEPGPMSTQDRLRSLGNQEVDLPEPLRPPTRRPDDRRTDRTDGPREPDLGLPAHPRRTPQTRPPRRRIHPSAGSSNCGGYHRHRSEPPTPPGAGSCARRPPACWPWTSSTSTALSR